MKKQNRYGFTPLEAIHNLNTVTVGAKRDKHREPLMGFTLVEFLIVIGIIIVLAGIVIVSFNPLHQMQKARNNQRESHINAIYLALLEYKSREEAFPSCLSSTDVDVYLCESDLVPDYISVLPQDPSDSCPHETGYFVKKNDSTERAGVKAECAEGGEEIIVGSW